MRGGWGGVEVEEEVVRVGGGDGGGTNFTSCYCYFAGQ